MEKYHNIFKNKYLIGDKIDSPISIKGIEKLVRMNSKNFMIS